MPDLLNGQQRLKRERADSVTMVITVAFHGGFFFLYRTPRSEGEGAEQRKELSYCWFYVEISRCFDTSDPLTVLFTIVAKKLQIAKGRSSET